MDASNVNPSLRLALRRRNTKPIPPGRISFLSGPEQRSLGPRCLGRIQLLPVRRRPASPASVVIGRVERTDVWVGGELSLPVSDDATLRFRGVTGPAGGAIGAQLETPEFRLDVAVTAKGLGVDPGTFRTLGNVIGGADFGLRVARASGSPLLGFLFGVASFLVEEAR